MEVLERVVEWLISNKSLLDYEIIEYLGSHSISSHTPYFGLYQLAFQHHLCPTMFQWMKPFLELIQPDFILYQRSIGKFT